jgi:hypothetical protein
MNVAALKIVFFDRITGELVEKVSPGVQGEARREP